MTCVNASKQLSMLQSQMLIQLSCTIYWLKYHALYFYQLVCNDATKLQFCFSI